MLRKAFCGFDAHVAKSDQSLRELRPPNPRGFFDRLFVVFTKKMVRVFRQPNHKAQNKNRIAKGKAALFYPGKTHPRGNGDV